jgi:hypothetical protein
MPNAGDNTRRQYNIHPNTTYILARKGRPGTPVMYVSSVKEPNPGSFEFRYTDLRGTAKQFTDKMLLDLMCKFDAAVSEYYRRPAASSSDIPTYEVFGHTRDNDDTKDFFGEVFRRELMKSPPGLGVPLRYGEIVYVSSKPELHGPVVDVYENGSERKWYVKFVNIVNGGWEMHPMTDVERLQPIETDNE